MIKYMFVLVMLLMGCSPNREVIEVYRGTDGLNGSNGHSIVSVYNNASEIDCSTSGTRLDLYLDVDDTLNATENDTYLNSIVSCNGSNGLNGSDGLAGTSGTNGEDGSDGADGLDGENGTNGVAGIPGAAGPTGATGPQGVAGSTGSAGPTGPQGPAGPQGIAGPAGSSGATITVYSAVSCTAIAGTTKHVKQNGSNFKFYTGATCASSSSFAEISSGESVWVSSNALAVWDASNIRVIKFN